MKRVNWLLLSSVLVLGSSIAQAKTWTIGGEQINLTDEVNQRVESGALTKEQAKEIKAQEVKVDQQEEKFREKNKGNLTADNQKKLEEDIQKLRNKMRKLEAMKSDNTGNNYGDNNPTASVTPQVQSQEKNDLELVQLIRQKIMADESLSANAKNVKVIVSKGTVTVRGPVDSATEKDKINSIVQECAGSNQVTSEIHVLSK